jgi:hypothetical protein
MSRELGKSERGEVSVRQSEFQRGSVCAVPRSIGATSRFRGLLRSDAALAELSISCGSSLPLLPDHRPKSASEPFLQLVEHFRCFTALEISDPSAEIFGQVMDHSDKAYAPRPACEFPNSLLEPCHRFRREAPLRLLVIREAEPKEFPFPWSSHRTLRAVHSQLELRREESRHASHHSFTGSPTADVDVAVIRIWASLPLASSPEHCLPHIQFLFISSRLCSTLLSDLTSRFGPCASLSLHLHLVVKRTYPSKLSDHARHTRKKGARVKAERPDFPGYRRFYPSVAASASVSFCRKSSAAASSGVSSAASGISSMGAGGGISVSN